MTPTSVAEAAPAMRASPWTAREVVFWGALAIALSATWFDLARHWLEEPWARPAALFVPLFFLDRSHDPRRPGAPALGTLLVMSGLGLSLLAFGGGLARLGRPGLALAMIGMAAALGRPAFAASLVALWVVPPPFALVDALSPGLQGGLAGLAAAVAEGCNLTAASSPHGLAIGNAALALSAADGGLPLASYLAGVGWWGAVRRGGGVGEGLVAALCRVPLGFVAQAAGLVLAFGVLAAGAPRAARALLDWLPWPVLALALLHVHRRGMAEVVAR